MRNVSRTQPGARSLAVVAAVVTTALTVCLGQAAAAEPQTLVVDKDKLECASAEFTSIQAAVDAAQAGDVIRICPDLYAESVTIDKPLTLKADPDAIEGLDCFQSTLAELPTNQYAVVDPAGDGFSIAFKLAAEDVVLEGFVVEGASVGIDASDRFSGYRVHHNLIRSNALFGLDFGSSGERESRVDHNCIRENRFGLVSELDDDRLWPDLGNRGPQNARDLVNTRIDHNSTSQNRVGLDVAGPGLYARVTLDHNISRGDRDGIAIQHSEDVTVAANESSSLRFGILLGGANTGLQITGNRADTGQVGIVFHLPTFFIDVFPTPTVGAIVSDNTVTGQSFEGIAVLGSTLHRSLFLDNVTSDNLRDGIQLRIGNTGNTLRGNAAHRNGRYGIYAQGATGNLFEANAMFENGILDARDDNREANTWIANKCVTDYPAGSICGIG